MGTLSVGLLRKLRLSGEAGLAHKHRHTRDIFPIGLRSMMEKEDKDIEKLLIRTADNLVRTSWLMETRGEEKEVALRK